MTTRSWPNIPVVAAAIGDILSGVRGTAVQNFDINTVAAVMGYTPSFTGAVQRTMQQGLSDVVSLKAFGAKGDGTTDDTAAINKARDSGCGLVIVPPGTYVCDQLDWTAETHIWGFGSNLCIFKSHTTTNGMDVHPTSSASRLSLRGFTLDGTNNSQPVGNYAGLLMRRKIFAEDIIVTRFKNDGCYQAPYDANLATGVVGTIGNAAFFSELRNCIFSSNGRCGLWSRMGFNANMYVNCQYIKNTTYGFHQSTDGTDSSGATGSIYGNSHTNGQASYNGLYGYFFENGTNVTTRSLYTEYNGAPNHTNAAGDAYSATPYDIYIGDNCLSSWFELGTLNGSTTTIKNSRVRLPAFNPDRIQVWEGGRKMFGN